LDGNIASRAVKGIDVMASSGRSLLDPDIAEPKTLSSAVLMNDDAT